MTDRCGMTEGRSRLRLIRRSALAAVVAGAVLAVTAAPGGCGRQRARHRAARPLGGGRHRERGGRLRLHGLRRRQLRERDALHAVEPAGERDGAHPGHAQARVDSLSAFQDRRPNGTVRALAVDAQTGCTSVATSRPSTAPVRPTWPGSTGHDRRGRPRARNVTSRQAGAGHGRWSAPRLYLVGDFTKVNGNGPQAGGGGRHDATAALTSRSTPTSTNKTYAVAYRRRRTRSSSAATSPSVSGIARSFLAAVERQRTVALRPAAYNGDSTAPRARHLGRERRAAGSSPPAAGLQLGRGVEHERRARCSGGNRADGDVQAVRLRRGATSTSGSTTATINGRATRTTPCGCSPPTPAAGRITPFAPAVERQRRRPRRCRSDGPYLAAVGKFPKMGGVAVKGVAVFACAPPSCRPRGARSPAAAASRPVRRGLARLPSRPCDGPAPDPRAWAWTRPVGPALTVGRSQDGAFLAVV